MLSTIVFAAIFVGMLIATGVLFGMFLRLGLRWAKVPDVTTRRIVYATAIVITLQIAISALFHIFSLSSEAESTLLGLVELAATVIVSCIVIRAVFKAPFLRALQAWLPTLLASVAMVAFLLLVCRPFLYEAFLAPTNSMAPTLVGSHWTGICPECGEPNYCSPRNEQFNTARPLPMICDNFHLTNTSEIDKTVHAADRFLVAKFLTPRRWDLVIFQYPGRPTELYVKRLVGLPGEKVHIKDGSVWIDGVRQTPPDSIKGIQYLSELPDSPGFAIWGSENRPALLGKDEYFVLGDFSAQSLDSRLWVQGAPGHNSFAVPGSYMKGVVTHTFWPPHRWRIHR